VAVRLDAEEDDPLASESGSGRWGHGSCVWRSALTWYILRDPGRAKGIRRSRWPRARMVNEIPSGVDGVLLIYSPPWPGCPARAAAAAPCVDGCPSVAYTRRALAGGRRPRFLDGAAPCSSATFGCRRHLPTRRRMPGARAGPWRRLLVALGLHPVDVRGDRLRFHNPAEPTVANDPPRPCPVPPCMFYSSLPGTVALRLSVCNIMASLHTLQRSPAK